LEGTLLHRSAFELAFRVDVEIVTRTYGLKKKVKEYERATGSEHYGEVCWGIVTNIMIRKARRVEVDTSL
jgi:hypothetical protein